MTNPYYNPSGVPGTRAQLSSSSMRTELAAVGTGFDKLAPTLTANALLHVNAAGTQQVAHANITVSAAGALAGITDLTTTGNTVLGNSSTDTLNVGNGGLIKDSAGNVGIGKSPNASAKLDVAGQIWADASSGDATIRFLTSGTEKGKLAVTSAGRAYIESNGTEVMTWLNGTVGIGTSTIPAGRRLVVAGGAMRLDDDAQLEWGGSSSGIYGNSADDTVSVFTATTLRLRVKADGQLNLVPLTSDPSGGGAGDLYFNGATGKFRGHNGSGWADLN